MARAARGCHTCFHLLLLGNGSADSVEFWYAVGVPLVTVHAVVTGGVSLHVGVHVQTTLLYLRNDLADCVQIWCIG